MYIRKVQRVLFSSKNKLKDIPEQGASLLIYLSSDKTDEVLLIQRNINPSYGRWSIPGGERDNGESFKDCALREATEELCGGKNILTLLRPYIEFKGENPKLISFWLYRVPFCKKRRWKVYVLHLKKRPPVSLFNPNYEVKNHDWFKISKLPKPMDITARATVYFYVYFWKIIDKLVWGRGE